MPKPIIKFTNPITATSGNALDPSVWLGGIVWVLMFGLITAMGVKALGVIDSKIPGNQTPDFKPYAKGVSPVNTGVPVI